MGAQPKAMQMRSRIIIPEGQVYDIYAIGDVHGCLDLLVAVEERIRWHSANRKTPALIVMLGDYVDRGSQSRGVIQHLTRTPEPPFQRLCLCGNHDDAFLSFILNDDFDPAWLGFGGLTTLQSYGVDAEGLLDRDPAGQTLMRAVREAVPKAHIDFLRTLPISISIGKYLFVHAGIVPGVRLSQQSDFDMLWIREPFLTRGPELDLMVIHGHTPDDDFQYGIGRIGIDTGAFATGKLKALYIGTSGIEEI
ncbi:serine/threonine protein phosphatase [Rhizobium sp. KVB221]|uniref:Serine/threonine protein phosphatase n=1 Tax=Rhizobium setariae TaxID=2801340 RepID=A0A937CPN2_9HYPH|nr:metallophosphoesterase family protein [Rhizobium setariae]MBL0372758.1 serine/threonine protein phosphatase [Rhizobium setariae]